jgi:hypothetical protein
MEPLSESQRQEIEAAGWTEEEVQGFIDDIDRFRGSLGEKQREVFDRTLALANDAVSDDDVSGFLVVPAIIGIIIAGPLIPEQHKVPLPPVQKPPVQRPAAQ